jgi:hypothetical protein
MNTELSINIIDYKVQNLKEKYNVHIHAKSNLFKEKGTYKYAYNFDGRTTLIDIKNNEKEILGFSLVAIDSTVPILIRRDGKIDVLDALTMQSNNNISIIGTKYRLIIKNSSHIIYDEYNTYCGPEENKVEINIEMIGDFNSNDYNNNNNPIKSLVIDSKEICNSSYIRRDITMIDKRSFFIGFVRSKIYESWMTDSNKYLVYEDYIVKFNYTWKIIKLIWIGYLKNNNNNNSYFSLLPKDLIKYIISLLNYNVLN